MNGGWLGARHPVFHEFESSLVWEFKLLGEFCEICEFRALRLLLCDWLHSWLSGSEKNCIVYCLFCIFIISISISFIALLNCLDPNPRVSPFVHFSSPSQQGRQEGVSERLSGAKLPAAGLNHDRYTNTVRFKINITPLHLCSFTLAVRDMMHVPCIVSLLFFFSSIFG